MGADFVSARRCFQVAGFFSSKSGTQEARRKPGISPPTLPWVLRSWLLYLLLSTFSESCNFLRLVL